MRISVHLEQKRHFRHNGSIWFEDVVSVGECMNLSSQIQEFLLKNRLDKRLCHDVYRSLPQIIEILKKRQVGRIASELTGRSSLCLVGDVFLEHPNIFTKILGMEKEEIDCFFLLFLRHKEITGSGVFFISDVPAELPESEEGDVAICFSLADRGPGSSIYPRVF